MNAAITQWATWASGGISVTGKPRGTANGKLGAWSDAPPLTKIHPRARRPHPTSRQLVQLSSALLNERRIEGLGLILGTAAGCAQPDREFQQELDTKGLPLGGPSLFVYTLPTAAAGELSIALQATGPLLTVNAGNASGLTAVVRGLEWVAQVRCPAALACSAELGVADEHIAMFLIERTGGRGAAVSTGFLDAPPSGAPAGALELAAALVERDAQALLARDERGFWASVHLEMGR
jgi:3-oxoacyl-(acyl-carrier-protein) synthase